MTLSAVPTVPNGPTSLFDNVAYLGNQVEASCPQGPAPASRRSPGEGMDSYDPERRERLAAFVGRLRKLCIQGGARPAIVAGLSAHALLELYARQVERQDRERAELDELMRQPPQAA